MGAGGAALLEADVALHGGAHVAAIRRVLTWHGLLLTLAEPARVDEAELVPRPWAAESPHPIAQDADGMEVFSEPGAAAVRVHFASLDMDASDNCLDRFCDAVYLYDGAGRLYARLGGAATDVNGPAIPGDTVVVRWVSNASRQSAGLIIDSVAVKPGPPPPMFDAGVPHAGVPDARTPPVAKAEGGCAVGHGRGGGFLVLLVLALVATPSRR